MKDYYNSNVDLTLLKKARELTVILIILFVTFVGTAIAYVLLKEEYIKNMSILIGLLVAIILYAVSRYYYYIRTQKYKIIIGICEEVTYGIIERALKKECLVFVRDAENQFYRFSAPLKKNMFRKGNVLKLVVPQEDSIYSRDGIIYLDSVLAKEVVSSCNKNK